MDRSRNVQDNDLIIQPTLRNLREGRYLDGRFFFHTYKGFSKGFQMVNISKCLGSYNFRPTPRLGVVGGRWERSVAGTF